MIGGGRHSSDCSCDSCRAYFSTAWTVGVVTGLLVAIAVVFGWR